MKVENFWTKDEFILRSAKKDDIDNYYENNFEIVDSESIRLTGSKSYFSKDEVTTFLNKSVEDEDRYLFFLVNGEGEIIGESVISEIDLKYRSASFRIAISTSKARGRGIGTWMTEVTRDFAFEVLKLHRLELEVFSFNPRAERVYTKAGFLHEGVLRDAILDGDVYADVILMSILEDEWREIKK